MKKAGDEYRNKKRPIAGLPVFVKAMFIKFWFAGAIFYYIGWGTFIQTRDQLDLIVALGLVLGTVTDILVNRILVYLDSYEQEYSQFALCYSKKYYSFPVNLVLYTIISFLIAYTYNFINIAYLRVTGLPETYVALGAGPIMYGLFFLLYDMIFLYIKKLFKKIFDKGRKIEADEVS